MSPISVHQATLEDIFTVSDILGEAALWLEQQGMPLWREDEVSPDSVRPDVESGSFYLALCEGFPAGVVKFQTEDPLFWPDIPNGDSAFIHRLAVRRSFAGGSVSRALLNWAVEHSGNLGKHYLRLDCVADRPRLRLVYERFGFRHHSNRQVGPFFVARYEYAVHQTEKVPSTDALRRTPDTPYKS
jgi:GNAT superfamily N-acetyltransferase